MLRMVKITFEWPKNPVRLLWVALATCLTFFAVLAVIVFVWGLGLISKIEDVARGLMLMVGGLQWAYGPTRAYSETRI